MKPTSVSATLDQLVAETGWLRRLAGSLIQDQAAVDDVVHDTVLVAAEQAPRDGRPLRPWLARVLLNRVRMHGRGASRRSKREQAVAELAVGPATPEAIVDRIELQRMLAGFVLELPRPLLDVVLLHYFEGLSSAAIGNRLGIANGTVRWRLKQAIDELRARLDQRTPNRGWVAPLAGFAGAARGTSKASPTTLAVGGIAAVLAVVAVVVLAWRALPDVVAADPPGNRTESIATIVARSVDSVDRSSAGAMTPGLDPIPLAADERRFTGIVVDSMGRPVDDAEISISCGYIDDGGLTTTRSTRDGTFALEVDRYCHLSVWAKKDNAASARAFSFPFMEIPGRRDEPLRLQLVPVPLAVFKVVDAETGAPVAGARVSTDDFRARSPSAVADATGLARVRIEDHADIQKQLARVEGETLLAFRRISVDAPGYPSVVEKLFDATGKLPDEGSPRTVRLVRGIPVSGRVVGPDGRGVAGSYVVIRDDSDLESRVTDADGGFEIAVPRAGRYRAKASLPGRLRMADMPPVAIEIGAAGRSDVVLLVRQPDRRGQLAGTVVDDAGNPVAGARVRSLEHQLRPVITDARGRFALPLGALAGFGERYRLIYVIASRGSLSSAFTPIELRGDGQYPDITLPLGPSGIAGVVVDLDGAPVPGADVWLNFCCGRHRLITGKHVEADAHGRFSFDVPRGEHVLSVRRSRDDDFDDRDDRTVPGGSHDVRLVIP